ncbi:hypothetical protein HaLaN_26229 [Haematococcus lacustris]|uniref:Uncharacterized protein n=1 Tax=Haematococcus lacustris TaxID=44745 RepID=A0A6A0A5R5_HAELA|nr:hypothetical protein HaLaN_26229 [Haematococcus lacustris]
MQTLGTCYVPVRNVLGLATDDPRFAVIALITECNSGGGATVVGSENGTAFRKHFQLDYEPSGFTVDGEGCIWLAHKSAVKRYTAEGSIVSGEGFRIPQANMVSAALETVAIHVVEVRQRECSTWPNPRAVSANGALYVLKKSSNKKTTVGQTQEQSVLMECHMVHGNPKVVAEHLAADCRIAVFPHGKMLFISTSRSLCQLDLGSKEVKVLAAAFPHPSASLFPGESGGALLVPGCATLNGRTPATEGNIIPPADTVSAAPEAVVTALHCLGNKLYVLKKSGNKKTAVGPNQQQWGCSQVHSCSSEGELTRHTRWFWGLPVVDSMLAVSSCGDILLFVKDKKNPQLLKLVRLAAMSVYKEGTTSTSLEACWLEDALKGVGHWLQSAGCWLLAP